MHQLLLALLPTTLTALLASFALTTRGRLRRRVAEDVALFQKLREAAPESPTLESFTDALSVHVRDYRAFVLGLDKLQRARRTASIILSVCVIAATATVHADLQPEWWGRRIPGSPSISQVSAATEVAQWVVLLVLLATGLRLQLLRRDLARQRRTASQNYVRETLVDDVREGRVDLDVLGEALKTVGNADLVQASAASQSLGQEVEHLKTQVGNQAAHTEMLRTKMGRTPPLDGDDPDWDQEVQRSEGQEQELRRQLDTKQAQLVAAQAWLDRALAEAASRSKRPT